MQPTQLSEIYFEGAFFIFRLSSIISISQKIFSIFFLTLEKIGIDQKSNLLP